MPRIVKGGLIQCQCPLEGSEEPKKIAKVMTEKTMNLLEEAGRQGVQVVCLQELFNGPYFPAEQQTRWYGITENIPEGPTTQLMMETAKRLGMVLIVPLYEVDLPGIYYNSAALIDADGTYLGTYRKNHIPHCLPGFWEKFYFRPGNLGYPVWETAVGNVGIYICYDRHFPEGARALALNGAEMVFNPSATVAGLSEYLWKLEQPAHAVANTYFLGAINRVGHELPWDIGEFYGQSYFVDPRGQFMAEGSRSEDEVVAAEMDLDKIQEVRNVWQFFRDRRPETYDSLIAL